MSRRHRQSLITASGPPPFVWPALAVGLWLWLAPVARAEAPPASGDTVTAELPPVSVTAEPLLSERQAENPSKFVTVIDTRDSSRRVETVAEALSQSAGVQVKSLGGMGGMSAVSIRGSSSSQVEVYLDGVPMNRAATGMTDLSNLPLDNLERIEVFRGFSPVDFAGAGIGGAINLVTRKDLEARSQVTVAYGSYDTYKAEAAASGPVGRVRLLAFAGYGASSGDFRYRNDNGTPLEPGDDFNASRVNNDFQSGDLTLRAATDPGAWELVEIVTCHYKDQGLPGLLASQAEYTRLRTGRATVAVYARNRELLSGALDLSLDADGLFESQALDDPQGEIGSGGPRRTDNRSKGGGAGGRLVWRPNARIALTAYTTVRAERYQPVDRLDDSHPGKEQSRDQLALAAQAALTDPTEVWLLQVAIRRDLYWSRIQGDPYFGGAENQTDLQYLDLVSPSVGLRYRVSPTLSLQANGGRFYRVPTFYELFGDRGTAVGNPSLEPESGVNFDLGFIYRGEGGGPVSRPFFEYAYFQSRMDDLILFFQNSQRTIRAVNIGGAWIGGHELAFALTLVEDFRLSGNYTFQSAIDEGDVPYLRGNALPFRPMHEAYGRVGWTPLPALEGWVEASYTSGNYWDRANLYAVPDREIYNAGATYTWCRAGAEAVSLTLEGKNLGDDRIADVAGYPLPGRSAFVTVQARW